MLNITHLFVCAGVDLERRNDRTTPARPLACTRASWTAATKSVTSSMSRRAKVTPDQVGLPAGHNRRVPGLRRAAGRVAGAERRRLRRASNVAHRRCLRPGPRRDRRGLQLDDAERDTARCSPNQRWRRGVRRSTERSPLERSRGPAGPVLDVVTAGPVSPAQRTHGRPRRPGWPAPSTATDADTHGRRKSPYFTFVDPAGVRFYPDLGLRRRRLRRGSCAPKPHATRTTSRSTTSSAAVHPQRRLPYPLGQPQRRHHGAGTNGLSTRSSANSMPPNEGLDWPPNPADATITPPNPVVLRHRATPTARSWGASNEADNVGRSASERSAPRTPDGERPRHRIDHGSPRPW